MPDTTEAKPSLVVAMPFLERDPRSVWTSALGFRDRIYEIVEFTRRGLNLEVLVNKSIDFVYPAWVTLEAWLPVGSSNSTHRMFCTFSIKPTPYSRFDAEVTVSFDRDGKKKTYGPYAPEIESEIANWTKFLLDRAPTAPIKRGRLRKRPWQFWLPRNKILLIGRDKSALSALAMLIVGGTTVSIGNDSGPLLSMIGYVLIIGGLVLFYSASRRRPVVFNVGRPVSEPRSLRLVDTWSTMVSSLGSDWERVRERLFQRLAEGRSINIQSRLENLSYITSDGKQERQQLVLTQSRGLLFCHVYAYGSDLYIGWDAHLNLGQWAERMFARGYDPGLRTPAIINTVVPGMARVTEYDLIDLNSLIEWTHSRVVQVVKQVMAEHKLDEEIDFKIQRGERQSLLRNQSQQKRKPLFNRATPRSDEVGAPDAS